MKTATIPSLRVEAKLRKAAESVLREGETLSSFVEQSLKANITRRRVQTAFIERGLAAREESRGAHARSDFPVRNDPTWLKHTLAYQTENGPRLDYRPVTITRVPLGERKY